MRQMSEDCQEVHATAPMQITPTFTEHFHRVALDIVGPLPRTGHQHMYLYTDIYQPCFHPDASHRRQRLLKQWPRIHYVRPETEPQHDLPDYHSSTELALESIRHSLTPDQLTQLITLLKSFQTVIDPKLSHTHLVSHKIVTGEALQIAQPYYSCPEAWKKNLWMNYPT